MPGSMEVFMGGVGVISTGKEKRSWKRIIRGKQLNLLDYDSLIKDSVLES